MRLLGIETVLDLMVREPRLNEFLRNHGLSTISEWLLDEIVRCGAPWLWYYHKREAFHEDDRALLNRDEGTPGNRREASNTWLVDSGASCHMT